MQFRSVLTRRHLLIQGMKVAGGAGLASLGVGTWMHGEKPARGRKILRLAAPSKLLRKSGMFPAIIAFAENVYHRSSGELSIRFSEEDLYLSQSEVMRRLKSQEIELAVDSPIYGSLAHPAAAFFSHAPLDLTLEQKLRWLALDSTLELWRKVYAPFGMSPIFFGGVPPCFGQVATSEIQTVEDFEGWDRHLDETLPLGATRAMRHSKAHQKGVHLLGRPYYANERRHVGYAFEILNRSEFWGKLSADEKSVLTTSAISAGRELFRIVAMNERMSLLRIENDGLQIASYPSQVVEYIEEQNSRVLLSLSRYDRISDEIYGQYLDFRASGAGA